jgi:hypothetical protein
MLKKMSCVFFLCILSLSCTFAQSPSLSNGFVTLVVKVRGEKNVKDLDLPIPFMNNPFQQDKPLPFIQVNDSTLMASAYSFGPSAVYMRLNGQYLAFMLVPKQVGTLPSDIQKGENGGLHYQGPFKHILHNSAKQ